MILERLLGGGDDGSYPGPPHVVERRHRDGSWIPVALGIRARDAIDALTRYRKCLPEGVWRRVSFRARLQEQGEFDGGLARRVMVLRH